MEVEAFEKKNVEKSESSYTVPNGAETVLEMKMHIIYSQSEDRQKQREEESQG